MKRNPINILNDTISEATEIASIAIRVAITQKRLNSLRSIDLRKYRGKPYKKDQIKNMIVRSKLTVHQLAWNGIMIINQPIQTRTFESGSAVVAEGEEIIINHGKH